MKKKPQLNMLDRHDIYRMKQYGYSLRKIGRMLHRAPSTIKREIERNGPRSRQERRQKWWVQSALAQERMILRRARVRPRMRLKNMRIRRYVEQKLKGRVVNGKYYPGLSPELISTRISIELPGESISHEAIYQWILIEAKHLIKYLEKLGKYRRRRKRTELVGRKETFENKKHISERPKEANKRLEIGHIERDAIESCREGTSAVLNSVDRKSRYLRARIIADLKAVNGRDATIEMLRSEPKVARRTITNDNGSENGRQDSIERVLGVEVYNCSPYAPWQRGSVERANRTLRRIFPKGTNFDEITEEELQIGVDWYNNRPMKILKGKTPAEVHQEELLKYKKAA